MQIASWDDVDKALLEMGSLDRQVAAEKAKCDAEVEQRKAASALIVKPLASKRGELEGMVEQFVRAHEAEMQGRSRTLFHGRVYLRKVTSVTARSWKRVLDWLLENKKMDYVRVSHEVNKEALRDAPEKLLKACGARLKPEDAFGCDPSEALPK
jgi:phage host-nuclease inhibitor protein Gam